MANGEDITESLTVLKGHQQVIETADLEIRAEFAATEAKIKAANLPVEILDRHRKAVADYEAHFQMFEENLQGIMQLEREHQAAKRSKSLAPAKAKRDQLKQRIKAARKHLEEKVKERPHTPLDPNNLPHRTPNVKKREPRLKKEQFAELQAPIQLAFAGDPSTLLVAQSTQDLPKPEDLAETIEVQFTQGIKELAAQLKHNPVQIYNWVRNNIDFVPTYGSIQGAEMCRMTKQCNDMDTASLLIALLRTSGIAARYVIGTIEVPIDKVMNWAGGFTDARAAIQFISSGGTPVTGLTSGGKLIAARMEHVWVEAYVDYIPSRGAVHKQGDTWIPLDASFKQFTFAPGIDLQTAVPFDAQGFIDQVMSTGTINETESFVTGFDQILIGQKFSERQQQLESFIRTNLPNATVADVLGRRAIFQQSFSFLSASLPYHVVVLASTFSGLSDTLRHKVVYRITGQFGEPSLTFNAPISTLAGKRITLSYLPATLQDQKVIETRSGQASLPAYLINIVPILRLEGAEVARGVPTQMGTTQQFFMEFNVPGAGGGLDTVQNSITAGAYYAIGLDPSIIPLGHLDQLQQSVEAVKLKLESDRSFFADTDEVIGQMLQVVITSYFAELDNYQTILGSLSQVLSLKPSTSAGIASVDLKVGFLFGIPFMAASSGGITLDVDRLIAAPFSTLGNKDNAIGFTRASGFLASALEFVVPEQVWKDFHIRGISTTKALEFANQNNIPIYRITKQNLLQVLPQLSVPPTVKNDILNGVNAGKEVTISQREVTIGSWTGIGYIVEDPSTGAAGYLISGGLAGGASIDLIDLLVGIISSLISAKYTTPGRGIGIIGALVSWARGIRAILITPNLNALERGVLATIAGAGLVGAVWAITTPILTPLGSLVAGIIVSIVAALMFTFLISIFTQALLEFLEKLYRYAKVRLQYIWPDETCYMNAGIVRGKYGESVCG